MCSVFIMSLSAAEVLKFNAGQCLSNHTTYVTVRVAATDLRHVSMAFAARNRIPIHTKRRLLRGSCGDSEFVQTDSIMMPEWRRKWELDPEFKERNKRERLVQWIGMRLACRSNC